MGVEVEIGMQRNVKPLALRSVTRRKSTAHDTIPPEVGGGVRGGIGTGAPLRLGQLVHEYWQLEWGPWELAL